MPIILFLFLLLYIPFGKILAIPYCFLSNGGAEIHTATAYIGPIVFALCCVAFFTGKQKAEDRGRQGIFYRTGGWVFWSMIGYFTSPIILNGISILLKHVGITELGQFVFDKRFEALSVLSVMVFTLIIVFDFIDRPKPIEAK